MAKGAFIGVDGVARKLSKKYIGVDGVARKISKGYMGVGGVARQFWPGGEPVSGLPVGSIVSTPVNGVSKNFIVVQQGIPSTAYDSSCSGTWLLMEDSYEKRVWKGSNANSYPASAIHSYLNSTFLNLLDSDIRSAVKTVKIPYTNGRGTSGTLDTGSSGLSAQVFLLSYAEVGFSDFSSANIEGAVLSYFNGADDSKRIAYFDGSGSQWWLRSPVTGGSSYVWCVSATGKTRQDGASGTYAVRPAFVLSSDALYTVENGVNVLVA